MKELLASVKMLSVDTFHTFFLNLSITLDYDTLYIAAGPMTINSPMAHLYYNTYIQIKSMFFTDKLCLVFQTVVKFTVKATSKNQPQAKQWKTMWNKMADSAVIFHNTFYVCPVLCLVQLFYWSALLSVLQPVSLMFHYFTDYVLQELLGLPGLSPLSVVLQFKESAVEKPCLSERSLSAVTTTAI